MINHDAIKVLGWILEPSPDLKEHGPKAIKGMFAVNAQDRLTIECLDYLGKISKASVHLFREAIMDSIEVDPAVGGPSSSNLKLLDHNTNSVIYRVNQDLTIECIGGF